MSDSKMLQKIPFLMKLKRWSFLLKSDLFALFNAFKHPLTPWYAKAAAILAVGYAVSPIDLIPDFVPVLGYLDDLVLLPLLISLAIKLIPPPVMDECRAKAEVNKAKLKTVLWIGAGLILLLWLLLAAGIWYLVRSYS